MMTIDDDLFEQLFEYAWMLRIEWLHDPRRKRGQNLKDLERAIDRCAMLLGRPCIADVQAALDKAETIVRTERGHSA